MLKFPAEMPEDAIVMLDEALRDLGLECIEIKLHESDEVRIEVGDLWLSWDRLLGGRSSNWPTWSLKVRDAKYVGGSYLEWYDDHWKLVEYDGDKWIATYTGRKVCLEP